MTLIGAYRERLKAKAKAATPGAGRLIEMQWQWLPWFLPSILGIGICSILGLSGPPSLWVLVPSVGSQIAGSLFVACVFIREGPIADYNEWTKRNPRGD